MLNLLLCNCYYSITTRTHWKTMYPVQHDVLSWVIPAVAHCIVSSVRTLWGPNFDSSFVKVHSMLTFYILKACPCPLLPPHMLLACLGPILHLWRGTWGADNDMGGKSESEGRIKQCLLSWTHWKRVCVLTIQNLVEVLSTIRTTVLNALLFCFVFREPAGIATGLEIIVNLLSRVQQLP